MAIDEPWFKPHRESMATLWSQIRNRATKNMQELKRVAIAEWNKISPGTTSNLVTNYKERMLMVIKMKGHATDY